MIKNQITTPAGSWFPTELSSYGYSFSEEVDTKEEQTLQTKVVETTEEEKYSTEKDETVNVKEVNEVSKSEPEPEVEMNDFELPEAALPITSK